MLKHLYINGNIEDIWLHLIRIDMKMMSKPKTILLKTSLRPPKYLNSFKPILTSKNFNWLPFLDNMLNYFIRLTIFKLHLLNNLMRVYAKLRIGKFDKCVPFIFTSFLIEIPNIANL